MSSYAIHKGVDKPAEFKGLQSQYLVIFALGLVASFLLVVVLHLCGVGQLLCFACGVAAGAGCNLYDVPAQCPFRALWADESLCVVSGVREELPTDDVFND